MLSIRNSFKKNDYMYIFFLAVLTALASEIKIVPFNGEAIRFGLGNITFFLFILIRSPHYIGHAGFITGIAVVGYRSLLDMIMYQVNFLDSLVIHLPAGVFYFLFALGLHIVNIEKYKQNPLLLGAIATGIEFFSNSVEHLLRLVLIDGFHISLEQWGLLLIVAIIRSYFAIGLYSSITIAEQKKQIMEMLGIGTELYAESLYLHKSMNHMEKITASSHDLYRKLKKENATDLSVQALHIAQEIHEVKKDSQRIYAGLTNLSNQREKDIFLFSELMDFVMSSNKKYSITLQKHIEFHVSLSTDFETNQHIALLAVLNNITANAVESIVDNGDIIIESYEESGETVITIQDTGVGIPKNEVDIIFEPGYTTKYNVKGVAATGIGLSHVQEIIQNLDGRIHMESKNSGTIFQIFIPTERIRK